MNAVHTKEELLMRIEENRQALCSFGIARIGLFGSFVRGEQRRDSDIDLLVDFLPGMKTFDNFMNAAFFLEELLGRRVELVTEEGLSPFIGPHIMKEMMYVPIAA